MKLRKQGSLIRRPWLHLYLYGGFTLFALVLLVIYLNGGVLWLTLVFGVLALLSLFYTVDSMVGRMELAEDALVIHALWRKKVIPRGQIERVNWEYGCGVYLEYQNGEIETLPDFGNAQSLCQVLRAWKKNN